MEQARFEQMVKRLEDESAHTPLKYQLKVALLAVAGFAILALIVGIATAGLMVLVGLAVAALFTGFKAILVVIKVGKLLLLLAIPLWFLVKSSVSALLTRLPAPQGLEITRSQAPALFAAIDRMRKRMKGPRFHHVLVTDEVNAAVVQRPLFGLFGWPRNYLILGLPLLDSLSSDEALAVVAHEYGHLAGSHSHFAAFIYRLRHTWATIQAVSEQWQGFGGRLLQRVVSWYAPYFNAYTFVLARANEYQADAASAELVGARVAASALKRVNLSAAHYDQFIERTFDRVRESATPPDDLSLQWASLADRPPADEAQRWLEVALQREAQLSDTHPVLRERLRALTGPGAHDAQAPDALQGPSAAQTWLGPQLGVLRETLQAQWKQRVQEPWQTRHGEIQAQRSRLDELGALAAPSVDEQLERLQLQLQFEPVADVLPALVVFNAAHADHPVGLYLLGTSQLKQGDAAGLDALEQAMRLDRDAIKPACEKAWAFLKERNDTRAADYAKRWNERDAFEATRAQQLSTLDVEHGLRAADLPPEALERINELLRRHRKGVRRAYLARRVLPVDPQAQTYVIGLQLTWWAHQRSQGVPIVEKLAQEDWPMHVYFCELDGSYKALKRKLQAIDGAEVMLHA